jgi:hypothetical protein
MPESQCIELAQKSCEQSFFNAVSSPVHGTAANSGAQRGLERNWPPKRKYEMTDRCQKIKILFQNLTMSPGNVSEGGFQNHYFVTCGIREIDG